MTGICGSEGDQQSLNRIRRSRESLDSGEIDPSEEECIEILETTSMDEEYRMLQSDLCLNLGEKSSQSKARTICVPIEFDDGKDRTPTQVPSLSTSPMSENDLSCATNASSTSKTSNSSLETVKPAAAEHKNEVMFKNFFGATKNSLLQRIRDNHEKKVAKKDKEETVKSPTELKKREFLLLRPGRSKTQASHEKLVPGVAAQCVTKESIPNATQQAAAEATKTNSSLLRFFESPIFNIHFAVHYLFYSKEPGVLSFIVNKIFSFPDEEVDLYIPQLVLMYIQMDELTDVLDPYLTYRCRRSVDFSLKCLWLLEAYNCNLDSFNSNSSTKKSHLALFRELNPKRERKLKLTVNPIASPAKKTHHRSQSDATGILNISKFTHMPPKLCLGDLNSGRAFDNGCSCYESVRGAVNDLLGNQIVCSCGAPKLSPQKEFMRALIDIGKTLTSLQSKIEKTSRLRVLLNLINKNLPARVWLPLYSETPHHVVRIAEEKTAVLNSKDKAPYIIYVEVVEIDDIYTSPVIPKMMPSLRHTKSEEFLDMNCDIKKSVSESSGDSGRGYEDDVWSQDDDYITTQYLNIHRLSEKDAVSQHSLDSVDSRDTGKLNIKKLFYLLR